MLGMRRLRQERHKLRQAGVLALQAGRLPQQPALHAPQQCPRLGQQRLQGKQRESMGARQRNCNANVSHLAASTVQQQQQQEAGGSA